MQYYVHMYIAAEKLILPITHHNVRWWCQATVLRLKLKLFMSTIDSEKPYAS
jgi:hypothetical protein